jgi:large subunit ribosomal protein L24e
MVVHRTCSFCAGEIEPGTGQLFVKRDGSLFSFCSSSCRKQQMGLGRVGHRLRWTRAHELKRLAEQRRQPAGTAASAGAPQADAGKSKAPADGTAKPRTTKKTAKAKPAEADTAAKPPSGEATPAKPRAKKSPTPPTPK